MAYKVFVFVPAFGQMVSAATFLTTHALFQGFNAKGIAASISTLSFPDIAELRGMAMTMWYETMQDSSHLLFVDADMGFAPEHVLDMLLFDAQIVGTLYPQRKLPLSWAGSGNGKETERRGNFMVVEGVGMGCTLIRRDVVTAMLQKMPELVDRRMSLHPAGETMRSAGVNCLYRFFEKLDVPDRGVISEDLSFCIRAAQCGIKTWAAIGHAISHVGPYDYKGRYLDMVEGQNPNILPFPTLKVGQIASAVPSVLEPIAMTAVSAPIAGEAVSGTASPEDVPCGDRGDCILVAEGQHEAEIVDLRASRKTKRRRTAARRR